MDAKNPNNVAVMQPDAQLTRTLKRLLICSLTIIGLPLVALFIAKKSLFENILHYSSEDSFLYAAISAVVAIHVVLAAFVYTAWTESPLPPSLRPELEKQD